MANEHIAPDIARIEVPLHKTPLKAINSYLVRGDGRNLLVDTGFNHPVSQDSLLQSLGELDVDMAETDIFVTHMHSDHAGLVQRIAVPGTRIFMSEADGRIVAGGREAPYWESFPAFFRFTGLEAGGHVAGVSDHPGYAYAPPASDNITFVPDGHRFAVGEREFVCVLTRGHTRGHTCLYETREKRLFCGDHILGTITPNITQMNFDHEALAEYLASLDLVAGMDVQVAHPSHRRRIDDCRGRIEELKRHHRTRLDEVMDIVGDHRVNTVDVTRRMQWSLTIRDWEEYPPAQKLFSAGEALAHLYHLARNGRLRMMEEDGMVLFERA